MVLNDYIKTEKKEIVYKSGELYIEPKPEEMIVPMCEISITGQIKETFKIQNSFTGSTKEITKKKIWRNNKKNGKRKKYNMGRCIKRSKRFFNI